MSNAPIVISGVHLELTEALKETVHVKVEKLLSTESRVLSEAFLCEL